MHNEVYIYFCMCNKPTLTFFKYTYLTFEFTNVDHKHLDDPLPFTIMYTKQV